MSLVSVDRNMKFLFLLIAAVHSLQPSTAVCPEDQLVEVLLAEILSAECMEGFARTTNPSSSDQLNAGIQQLCVEQCINNITNHFRNVCNDNTVALRHENACLLSNNAGIGPTCAIQHIPDRNLSTLLSQTGPCLLYHSSGTCIDFCRQGLMAVSEQFDCCHQHYYNNTAYLDALFMSGRLTQQQRDFFDAIGNASLWEACNVPIVGTCLQLRVQPTTATQGAVRAIGTLATSITAAFTAAVITLILSAV